MSFLNRVHEAVAGEQEARTRFLADGGSGGGSVFAGGSVTQTSTVTLVEESAATRLTKAPAPQPEPEPAMGAAVASQPKCTSLYYVDANGVCYCHGCPTATRCPGILQAKRVDVRIKSNLRAYMYQHNVCAMHTQGILASRFHGKILTACWRLAKSKQRHLSSPTSRPIRSMSGWPGRRQAIASVPHTSDRLQFYKKVRLLL